MTKQKGSAHVIIIAGLVLLLLGALGFIFWQNFINKSDKQSATAQPAVANKVEQKNTKAKESYDGTYTSGGNFQAKIPNGWTVDSGAYDGYADSQLVLLAGPNRLEALKYDQTSEPIINGVSGFGWDGLTEHFYIISQENTARNHANYEKVPFTLDNGIKGEKFTRVLSKDQQQGMSVFQKEADTYTFSMYDFTKDGVTVSAYLNYYSNTTFDVELGEDVIRSIKF